MSITIDWDTIDPTHEAWSEVLERLLDAARAVAGQPPSQCSDVIDALSAFIVHSPSNLSGQLDAIARRTADELFGAAAEDLLRSLDERRATLESLRSELGEVTRSR
ncbi:MAG: hypothetical protein Tsb0020_19630 [Haliangiales bacterium]